jgi:hypothetical protein
MTVVAAPSARAATYNDIAAAMQTAYSAYLQLVRGDLPVGTATTRIINAYNGVKPEIIAQLDAVTPISLRQCARRAVDNYARIPSMSSTELATFASQTRTCTEAIYEAFVDSRVPATWDQRGFAGIIVGPIGLIARYRSIGRSDSSLYQWVAVQVYAVSINLEPLSCMATPLWGDAEPGAPVEVILRCTAYNGNSGADSIWANIRRGQPLPAFDYTKAKHSAARGTSYVIAVRVWALY